MNTAEQILVIFLSTALAIFLVLAIVAAVQVVRLLKKLETLAEAAESVSDNIRQAVERATMLTTLQGVLGALLGKHTKRNRKEED